MRGFMAGTIWGLVLVSAGAVTLSLLYPAAPSPDVGDLPTRATAHAPAPVADGVASADPDADPAENAPAAPGAHGTPDDLAPLTRGDTAPADRPRIGAATETLTIPDETAPAPQVPAAGTVQVPQEESIRLPVTTEPSQPLAPGIPAGGSGFGRDGTRQTGPDAPAIQVSAAEEGSGATAPTPDVEADYQPRLADLPQAGTGDPAKSPLLGHRARPLIAEKGRGDGSPEPDQSAVRQRPLDRYAVSFENTEDQPLLSIVLIDDDKAQGLDALTGFPHPISFAIDPAAPDAPEKMARHRAAGHEVVALVDLPEGATAQDAEVALFAGFDLLNETVGLLEGAQTGIGGSRALSDQVSVFLAETGRGLITRKNGLNSVQKFAARRGVPSAVVFRDFDGAGQTPTAMRRFLDQAALRAGQEGGVIMLGRVRPETVSALLLWGDKHRAARVALAPVSAVLRQSTN